jgi:hypothetical protein
VSLCRHMPLHAPQLTFGRIPYDTDILIGHELDFLCIAPCCRNSTSFRPLATCIPSCNLRARGPPKERQSHTSLNQSSKMNPPGAFDSNPVVVSRYKLMPLRLSEHNHIMQEVCVCMAQTKCTNIEYLEYGVHLYISFEELRALLARCGIRAGHV